MPFIGDGDIALDLYDDRRIYGADLSSARVDYAESRLRDAHVKVADCNAWTFPGLRDPVAVADFDAYVDPYEGFRAFWDEAPKGDRLVMFFTDGQRQSLMRVGKLALPDGTRGTMEAGDERSALFNFYLSRHVWPWFEDLVAPYRVLDRCRYLRGWMVYWGAVIEKP